MQSGNRKSPSLPEPEKYTERGFWDKLSNQATTAGRAVVKKSLELYYTAKQEGTPITVKTAIYSALAYFIIPIDAVPDMTPLVGYGDDAGVLATALGLARAYMTAETANLAKDKLSEWFGSKGPVRPKTQTPQKADGSKYNPEYYRKRRMMQRRIKGST